MAGEWVGVLLASDFADSMMQEASQKVIGSISLPGKSSLLFQAFALGLH